VFNGKRFREEIYPRVREFIWRQDLQLAGVSVQAALPKKTEPA
jgi:poly-beta-hydroxyalkanoate depolymerase